MARGQKRHQETEQVVDADGVATKQRTRLKLACEAACGQCEHAGQRKRLFPRVSDKGFTKSPGNATLLAKADGNKSNFQNSPTE